MMTDSADEKYYDNRFDNIEKKIDKLESAVIKSIERTDERSATCKRELYERIETNKRASDAAVVLAKQEALSHTHDLLQPVADDVKSHDRLLEQVKTYGRIGAVIGTAMLSGIVYLLLKQFGG